MEGKKYTGARGSRARTRVASVSRDTSLASRSMLRNTARACARAAVVASRASVPRRVDHLNYRPTGGVAAAAFPSARAFAAAAASRTASSAAAFAAAPKRPSTADLRKVFAVNMIPFVAFGFIDNSVLIYAGDAIDGTVGVAFGLSSLAAAAMGQIFSDTSGVLFGSTIEDMVLRLGLTLPQLTPEQQLMRATRFASTAGKVVGVISGCTLGLGNLLFIDTLAVEKAKEEKEYTAIFRAIMHKGHEVAECAAAALWIIDYDKREIWTRAAHGNRLSNLPIRRPFGVGIVGSVAETGELSNVTDAYSHPNFDRTIDRDGITGFPSESILTCPVKDKRGRVVAVVQLVNKIPPERRAESDREGARGRRGNGWGLGIGRAFGFGRARPKAGFDESDEKLIRLMSNHVAVSLAAMEHRILSEEDESRVGAS